MIFLGGEEGTRGVEEGTLQESGNVEKPIVKRKRGRPRKDSYASPKVVPTQDTLREGMDNEDEESVDQKEKYYSDPVFRAGAWATPKAPTSIKTRTAGEPEELVAPLMARKRQSRNMNLSVEDLDAAIAEDEKEVDSELRQSIPTSTFETWKVHMISRV